MIAGIFSFTPKADFKSKSQQILTSLNYFDQADKTGSWSDEYCLLVQTTRFNTRQSQFEPCPYIDQENGMVTVSWATIYNRDEVAEKLSLKDVRELSDSELIYRCYQKFGEDCVEYLHGDFTFVIYNSNAKKMLCVRDRMGVRPFYYHQNKDCFVFASTLSIFHTLKEVTLKPSSEWMSKFIVANMSMDFEKTAYENVFKLRPSHQLAVSLDKKAKQKKYFEFHTHKIELESSEAYVECYEALLKQVIQEQITTDYALGSEISGGLDSSTVTSYAAKYFEQSLTELFTYGFAHLEYEPKMMLQVNQRYGISNSYICCSNPSFDFDREREQQALGYPVEHSNATGHEIFYKKGHQNGVRTLLSGFGGDEFVTSIHGDLVLHELLRDKKYWQLYKMLGGRSFVTRFLRLVKKIVTSGPEGRKKSHRMYEALTGRWPNMLLKEKWVQKFGIKSQYFQEAKFDDGYNDLDQFTLDQRWVPFVSTRMENCSLMAESYGIEYRWPLLDPRLIQLFLSIPSKEKFYRGMGRYLHRRAVAKVVPKDITWQRSKYMGEPVGPRERNEVGFDWPLHSSIAGLVDEEKLKMQLDALNNKEKEPEKDISFSYGMNISNVKALDSWLKTYDFE